MIFLFKFKMGCKGSETTRNINNAFGPGIASKCTVPHSSVGKESACNSGGPGLIPGLGRSPGEGNGNPLQYSCLENPTTEEPGRLQSMGSQWVGHDLATKPPPPQRWFKKLCKEDESLEDESMVPGHQKLTNGEDHQNWSFYNIGEVAEELCVNHSTVIWCLKQIGKVEKLSKGVHHGLIKNHKKLSFWSIIFSYYMQQQIISLSDYDIWWKVDFIQQPAMTSSVVGLGRSSKHFLKPNCAQKRSWSLFGGLLPIWPTTAFWILMKLLQLLSMLSELMRYTKNCKASSDGR